MKRKALLASSEAGAINWSTPASIDQDLPGGSVLVSRLCEYQRKYPDTRIHLVGHSAGSIYAAGLLHALKRAGLKADTVTLMAPAIRNNSFQEYFGNQTDIIGKLTVFNMSDKFERADRCRLGPLAYDGSLLYLVARGFEQMTVEDVAKYKGEVPLVGMEKFNSLPLCVACEPIDTILKKCNGHIVYSPSGSPPDGRTRADSHHAFSIDVDTFDSIARIITNRADIVSFGLPTPLE